MTFKKIVSKQIKAMSENLDRFKYICMNIFNELGFLSMIQ
jgi:hypothetical protein